MGENLYIFGQIGWEIDAKMVSEHLQSMKGDELTVYIHSRGGNVAEGFAIYELLSRSGKKVTTEITGLCASIATIISLAGSVRRITPNSEFMIHNPWVSKRHGDADEYEKTAERLRMTEQKVIDFYHEKTGASKETIKSLMKAETFLTPEQALEMGFITEVLEPVQAMAFLDKEGNDKEAIEMNTKVNSKLDVILAYLKPKKKEVEQPKEEIQNWELSLQNGQTIVCNNPENQNGPSVNDFVKIKDEAEQMEDGDYIIASTNQTLSIEGGKITAIQEAEENDDQANLEGVMEVMSEMAKSTGERFEQVEILVKANEKGFETIEALIKDSFDKIQKENDDLKAELNELRKGISSDYTPPKSHEVPGSHYKPSPDKTTEELNKIKNRNK